MVNMSVVQDRLLKGAYVGVGAFASEFVGSSIENFLGTSGLFTDVGLLGVGLGVSMSDQFVNLGNPMINQFAEYAGYGIEGAAFADAGRALNLGTGLNANDMISVQANASDAGNSGQQAGQNASQAQSQAQSQDQSQIQRRLNLTEV